MKVLGIDVSAHVVETVNSGKVHIEEVDLDGLVQGVVARGLLSASTEVSPADVFVIAVPTPFDKDHAPDISYVLSAGRSVAPVLKAGDVVILQFGHNDNGARGALSGIGDETQARDRPGTKETETVHTFGWYLRRYIDETRAQGATPVVCSLVPRNRWHDGKIARPADSHADWARAVAESEQAPFLDLNRLLADRYDALGQDATTALFADKAVHTNWAGAELTARVVADALRALPKNPVAEFMRPGM